MVARSLNPWRYDGARVLQSWITLEIVIVEIDQT
jgi:hypothetical protein